LGVDDRALRLVMRVVPIQQQQDVRIEINLID